MKKLLSLMALFVISLLTVSMVSAGAASTLGGLKTDYGKVAIEVNDEEDDSTLLVVEEGEEVEVEVELSIQNDNNPMTDLSAKNVEVEARLTSADNDEDDVVESATVDKLAEGTEKTVKLKLKVPSDFPNGEATLKVLVFGGTEELVKNYKLHVESPNHSVKVADVTFSPGLTVKAGHQTLLTTVLVENVGDNPEEDVKVTVAVPALGLSASEYLDEVKADDKEDVDEMFLNIPYDTKAGEYEVKVTVQYDDLEESVTETYTLKVVENDLILKDLPQKSGKTVLAAGPEMQTVAAGKTATYAVALTNDGSASKAYAVEAATGDWATASVSEKLVVLEPGKSAVVYVDLTAADDATAGEHLASLTVKSGSDVLAVETLKAAVTAPAKADSETSLRNGLEIALVVLVVLLVLLGLVIGFSRLRKDDDGEEKYY